MSIWPISPNDNDAWVKAETRRGVVPILYGDAFAGHANVVLDELKQCISEIQFLADQKVGELRIGSSERMKAMLRNRGK